MRKKIWKKLLSVSLSVALVVSSISGVNFGLFGPEEAEAAVAMPSGTVSIHDPSIVKGGAGDAHKYYIFGSHMSWAYSDDLETWTTFTNNINTDFNTIFADNFTWSAKGETGYANAGNMWAPDVIWNPNIDGGKWCMYMSINGNQWNSSICMLTADTLDGNWTKVGDIVYSGFTGADTTRDVAGTNYAAVVGSNNLPEHYRKDAYGATDSKESTTWNNGLLPHAIDPCVFFDNGQLYMSYGSWSGGIYILKLDPATGLRDNGRNYENNYKGSVHNVINDRGYSGETVTEVRSDAYFGKKIAGKNMISGEASYIKKIGDKYYLFLSYGGFSANGGYQMRVYRSDAPDGTYTDMSGDNAASASAGNINGNYGLRLMTYYKWDWMPYGQVAQGHNSVYVDDKGTPETSDDRYFVIYHTRTNDGTEGHFVRVHEMFMVDGWLTAAPMQYSTTDTTAGCADLGMSDIAGTYQVIMHKNTDTSTKECVESSEITLAADGTISGAYTGRWEKTGSQNKVTFTIGGVTYTGVLVKQTKEGTNKQVLCFTALGNNEISFWGAKVNKVSSELKDGLVGYYTFDDTLENAASTTNGAATLHGGAGGTWNSPATGTATYVSGKNGKAYSFTGDNGGVRGEGLQLDVRTTSEFTVSYWVNPDTVTSYTSMVFIPESLGKGINITNNWGGSSFPTVRVWGEAGTPDAWLDNYTAAADSLCGQWTYVTFTYAADGKLTLYVNGVPVSRNQHKPGAYNNFDIFLGINFWDISFDGAMDDVLVYNRALQEDEVSALYGINGNIASLDEPEYVNDPRVLAYYTFDDTLADSYNVSGAATLHGGAGDPWNSPATGTAAYVSGKNGKAYSFTGDIGGNKGEGLKLGTNLPANFTINAWMKTAEKINHQPSIFVECDFNNYIVHKTFVNDYSSAGVVNFDGNWNWLDKNSPSKVEGATEDLTIDAWTFVTITGTSNGTYRMYYDGKLVAENTVAGYDGRFTDKGIYLGINWFPLDASYKGLMDDVSVYNDVLSAEEVAALYANNGVPIRLEAAAPKVKLTNTSGFSEVIEGYTNTNEASYKVENTGNVDLAEVTASLQSGAAFTLSTSASIGALEQGESATVKVKAKSGLAAGTYTDKLIISAAGMDPKKVEVKFVVKPQTREFAVENTVAFPAVKAGYASAATTYKITNIGNSPISGVVANLGTGRNFTITGGNIGTLQPGASATVTINANTGLKKGSYTDSLVVSGTGAAAVSKNIEFIVSAEGKVEYTLGDLDCSGWWVVHSKGIPLSEKLTTITFTNKSYATATSNWNTPIYVLYSASKQFAGGAGILDTPGYKEKFVMRSDVYGWIGANNTAGDLPSGYSFDKEFKLPFVDWDEWLATNKAGVESTITMQKVGDYAVITMENHGASSKMIISVKDIADPIYLSLSGELCNISKIKVTVEDKDTAQIITPPTDTNTSNNNNNNSNNSNSGSNSSTNTDGTTTYTISGAWWTAWTPGFKLDDELKFSIDVKGGADNWNNVVAVFANVPTDGKSAPANAAGYKEYAVVRADNWGWGGGDNLNIEGNEIKYTTPYSAEWTDFVDIMKDAHIDATFTKTATGIKMEYAVKGANGKSYNYVVESDFDTSKGVYVFFVCDNSTVKVTTTAESSEGEVVPTTEKIVGTKWWDDMQQTSDKVIAGDNKTWVYTIVAGENNGDDAAFCVEITDNNGIYITTGSHYQVWTTGADGQIIGNNPDGVSKLIPGHKYRVSVTREGYKFTINYYDVDADEEYCEFVVIFDEDVPLADELYIHVMAQIGEFDVTFEGELTEDTEDPDSDKEDDKKDPDNGDEDETKKDEESNELPGSSEDAKSEKSNTAKIVAIVVGIVAGVVAVGGIVAAILYKKKKSKFAVSDNSEK